MDGLLILHAAQGSQDSTDSGSLPPTYSRLPPDGHEFPEDYMDPGLAPGNTTDPQSEFLSRKSSASSTSSLDRNQLRANTSTRNKKVQSAALLCAFVIIQKNLRFRSFDAVFSSFQTVTLDEKLSGVRAKIALFSSENSKGSVKTNLGGKFQSTEDVGKAAVGGSGLTRAHTHTDVRFDEGGLKRQSSSHMSLKSLNNEERGSGKENASLQKSGSNLKPQNKSTSFRSMINVSSSQVLVTSSIS